MRDNRKLQNSLLLSPFCLKGCAFYRMSCKSYAVAVVTGLASGVASLMWVSAAPAADTLQEYFHVSKLIFTMATGAFYAGTFVGVFLPGMFLMYRYDLRILVISANAFTLAGATLRVLAYPRSTTGFSLLVAGNFVGALSVPILVSIPTRVSIAWFPLVRQATAIGLCMIMSGALSILGLEVTTFLITDPSSQTNWIALNAMIAGIALATTALTLCCVGNRPVMIRSKPADRVAEMEGFRHTWRRFKQGLTLFRILAMLQYSVGIVVYWNVQLSIGPSLRDAGYTDDEAGTALTIFAAAALPGVVISVLLADRTRNIRAVSQGFWWFAMGGLLLLGFRVTGDGLGTGLGTLYIFCGIAGMFLAMISPVMYTLVSDTFYPLAAFPLLFMYVLAQVLSIAAIFAISKVDSTTAWYIQYGIFVVPCLLSVANYRLPVLKSDKARDEELNNLVVQ